MTTLYNNPCVTTLLKPNNLAFLRTLNAVENNDLRYIVVREMLKEAVDVNTLKVEYIDELIYHITNEVSQVLSPRFVFSLNDSLVDTIENLPPEKITEQLITGTVIMHLNTNASMFEFNLYVILSAILNIPESAKAVLTKRLTDAGLGVFQEVADLNVEYLRKMQDIGSHIEKYKYNETFVNSKNIKTTPVQCLDPIQHTLESEYITLLKMRDLIFTNDLTQLIVCESPYTQVVLTEVDSGFITLMFFKEGYIILNDIRKLLADAGVRASLNDEELPLSEAGIHEFIKRSVAFDNV